MSEFRNDLSHKRHPGLHILHFPALSSIFRKPAGNPEKRTRAAVGRASSRKKNDDVQPSFAVQLLRNHTMLTHKKPTVDVKSQDNQCSIVKMARPFIFSRTALRVRVLFGLLGAAVLLLDECCAFTAQDTSSHHSVNEDSLSRRDVFAASVAAAASGIAPLLFSTVARADSDPTATTVQGVEMKMYIDPQGMFAVNVPKRFFALRRTAKGDLPDEKTGSGRRGSSIFSAGDMAKAEVIAVERYVMSSYTLLVSVLFFNTHPHSIFNPTRTIIHCTCCSVFQLAYYSKKMESKRRET